MTTFSNYRKGTVQRELESSNLEFWCLVSTFNCQVYSVPSYQLKGSKNIKGTFEEVQEEKFQFATNSTDISKKKEKWCAFECVDNHNISDFIWFWQKKIEYW